MRINAILLNVSVIISILFVGKCLGRELTQKQQNVVAAVLILEAGGEKDSRAMSAVMEVIYNRARAYNQSVFTVVTARKQFSCLNNVTYDAAIAKAKKHPKFKKALEIVNSGPTNYTKGATHYFADYIKAPSWSRNMEFTVKIGRHLFFRE